MTGAFPFEDFPYRELIIKVPRRDFLHSMLKQMSGTAGKLSQKPTYRIEDLGLLHLEEISSITPAIYSECQFKILEGFVYGKAPRHLEYTQLFPENSPAHVLFEFFYKNRSIEQLSISHRKRFPMDREKSLKFVRGLFLFLVESGIAYPKTGVPKHAE